MTTIYPTKCGKPIHAPAMFVNPQTEIDATTLRQTMQLYPSETAHIEGIVVGLKDWQTVKRGLNTQQRTLFESLGVDGRIKIIDPSLHIIFQGAGQDKEELLSIEIDGKRIGEYKVVQGGLRLRDAVSAIKSLDGAQRKEKIERYMREVYPYMDSLIKPIMEFEIKEDSGFVIVPSVPITSLSVIERQIEKARSMNRAGKVLSETLLSKQMKGRDLMFMLTVNPSVLRQEHFDEIISTLIFTEEGKEIIYPDQIGIRIMNLDRNNTDGIQSLLDFIAHLAEKLKLHKKKIPIHIFNVREFGYVTFSHGATSITTPIAKSPYIQMFDPTSAPIDKMGRYYHPIDMEDYNLDKSLALSRSVNYRLPCHCRHCERARDFLTARDNWNIFRRIHFLLAKNIEMEEIKTAPAATLNRHLQQKFSRSKQTVWLAFLDRRPILTFA